LPGGPATLDQADETDRNRCPVQQTAVARRLPPRVGHRLRGTEQAARREEAHHRGRDTPDAAGAGAHPEEQQAP
jgi:hypothetical protein